ncbi:ABC transporter substrate-binding protein [Paenibacillus terrigena]|uniref:ABC transporter substrate-binding protein n=1 Tax=Paenibacillus terrigena TaxID=369333 RepID=UPI00036F793C|nr:ABC transporter substrate-binding protein [Paenibacillus terrigena]
MNAQFRKWGLLTGALLLALAVGCSSKEQTAEAGQETTTQVATEEKAAAPASAYTVDETKAAELQAQFGDAAPSKVVVASVAISEILNELGVMPVGVPTSTLELPAAFKDLPRIGSALKPDVEQVTKLQPDVILGPESIKTSLDKQFKPANLNTAYLPADSLEELKLTTVVLSRIFKKEDQANAFLAKLAEQEKLSVEQASGKTQLKIMILFGSAESFMMMNENTFAGSIAKKLGASNVVSDVLKSEETYIPLNMENVVAANPDVILLVAHGDANTAVKKFEEDVKKNGAWDKLNAFKNDKVKALDYNLFGVASVVKASDAYQQMLSILYS